MSRPKKSLGQNFLVDRNLQRKIVGLLEAGPEDEVLEIGPGRGALTAHLAGTVRRLVLVELDDELVPRLRERFGEVPGVEVVHADILSVRLEELTGDPAALRVIGNIPYNITSPILFSLLERDPRPARIVLMVQREVADRIVAPPGDKTYGALSVGVQAVADARRALDVGRQVFRPVPDVDSAVVVLDPHRPTRVVGPLAEALRALTRACFARRRKQLRRILRDVYGVRPEEADDLAASIGVDPRARPETLAPEQFVELADRLPAALSHD